MRPSVSPQALISAHQGSIDAVLFDYGGVLADVVSPSDGFARMATLIHSTLATGELRVDDVATDLEFGWHAYSGWKAAQSRTRSPRELSQREFWEFVVCDWNEPDRAAVLANAVVLTRHLELTVIERPALPETAPTLAALRDAGIKTAIVSNCLSGAAARVQLEKDQLLDLFDVMMFSDESGCRKPGAEIIERALTALNTSSDRACFVGDRLDRDVLAARRAGIRLCVLRQTATGAGSALRGVSPDTSIDSLAELLPLAEV